MYTLTVPHHLSPLLPLCTMAYSRDWDRGKSTWDDANAWSDFSGRSGNVRSRDEEFQGDGKRRKYNNGVCQYHTLAFHSSYLYGGLYQGHDPSHSYEEDPANVQGQDDRPQRGFTKKRLMPSEPSPHVIFLGLDPDFTEADVCRLLHVLAMCCTSLKRCLLSPIM
jgi:RNA-binding protein 5/10